MEDHTRHARRQLANGMGAAVEIMRLMAQEPSIRLLCGPEALKVVAEAIEKEAAKLSDAPPAAARSRR